MSCLFKNFLQHLEELLDHRVEHVNRADVDWKFEIISKFEGKQIPSKLPRKYFSKSSANEASVTWVFAE